MKPYYLYLDLFLAIISVEIKHTSPKNRELETVITGSKYSGGSGEIYAPPGYPEGRDYVRDAASYIFVLENVAVEGSVEVTFHDFDIHPQSWITIRTSKYGGYIGRVMGRYNRENLPPTVVRTETCCLRIEFQTGCCGSAEPGYTGFHATYKFVTIPGKGRRSVCTDKVYRQLCNGECILDVLECPCPKYGQFKCDNSICVGSAKVCDGIDDCGDISDERLCKYTGKVQVDEDKSTMYAFTVIITTVCSLLAIAAALTCVLIISEKIRKKLALKRKSQSSVPHNSPVQYAKMWPHPERGITLNKHDQSGPKLSPGPPQRANRKTVIDEGNPSTSPDSKRTNRKSEVSNINPSDSPGSIRSLNMGHGSPATSSKTRHCKSHDKNAGAVKTHSPQRPKSENILDTSSKYQGHKDSLTQTQASYSPRIDRNSMPLVPSTITHTPEIEKKSATAKSTPKLTNKVPKHSKGGSKFEPISPKKHRKVESPKVPLREIVDRETCFDGNLSYDPEETRHRSKEKCLEETIEGKDETEVQGTLRRKSWLVHV